MSHQDVIQWVLPVTAVGCEYNICVQFGECCEQIPTQVLLVGAESVWELVCYKMPPLGLSTNEQASLFAALQSMC